MRWWWRRKAQELDLERELRAHLELETEEQREAGVPPDQAGYAARRVFGNTARIKEDTRAEWGWQVVERLAQDLGFARRMLRKSPGFTTLALTVLALGIGATTAVFSVVNSVLLRPLRFPEPGRLVMVWERPPQGKLTNVVQTQNFLDWRKWNRSFEGIAALQPAPMNLEEKMGDAVQLPGLRVTAGFFEILGVRPLMGRSIQPQEDIPGAAPVAVLSFGLWQRRFGGRASAVGEKIAVNGAPCTVVGVTPPDFAFPTVRADLYVPMRIDPSAAPRDGRNFMTIARMHPHTLLHDAQADMKAIAAQTAEERPNMNAKWSATVVPLAEQTVGESRRTLLVLLGAVGFVLLIACANVSNLLLMRASARRREMTMRVALGAGLWRLLHQLMIESLVLAVAGGSLGFALAYWGVPAVIRMLPLDFPLPRMSEISVDGGVLTFSLVISVSCGLFFGLFPALQVDRGRIMEGLRQGGWHGTAGNRRLRNAMAVTEVAVAMLLVIGAGLMLHSFLLLHDVNPGFQPDRLLTFRMLLLPSKYLQPSRRAVVIERMLERIRALPSVASASSIHLLPLAGLQSATRYYRVDQPIPPPGAMIGGDVSVVSDGYFHTMGIPLLAGRDFDRSDRLGTPDVAILNQTAARQFFPGENPIGQHLAVSWYPVTSVEVIGIVADIRHNGLDVRPEPCLFLSQIQAPSLLASLVIRSSGDPLAVVPAIREQMRAVDPDQGALDIKTMEEVLSDSIARPKLDLTILGIFGILALALASIGIYAVISYSVEQRRREMGIRVALGAASGAILGQVLREALFLAGTGIAAGGIVALAMTRYLRALLYGVSPTDPVVFTGVGAVLVAAVIAGCYLPARRAIRIDPALVLREE
jgi:putative ABC transport system permease protein